MLGQRDQRQWRLTLPVERWQLNSPEEAQGYQDTSSYCGRKTILGFRTPLLAAVGLPIPDKAYVIAMPEWIRCNRKDDTHQQT